LEAATRVKAGRIIIVEAATRVKAGRIIVSLCRKASDKWFLVHRQSLLVFSFQVQAPYTST